ncbi:MAG: WD40 repeat domain-containing protein, partial [Verrucomicrobia bacterium]|nr:WD40 repeat domain-containing protein [Verrucomicrobiota bacterium]
MERISIWARRRPLAAGLVATVLVLLVILGISGQVSTHRQKILREKAEAGEERLRHENYQYTIKLAQSHIDGGNPHLALPLLWDSDISLRNWEWGHLMAQCPLTGWSRKFEETIRRPIKISKDGSSVFAKDRSGALIRINAKNKSVMWRKKLPGFHLTALSPNARFLAVRHSEKNGAQQIKIYDTETGQAIQDIGEASHVVFVWSPDSNYLYSFLSMGKHGRIIKTSVQDWSIVASLDLDQSMAGTLAKMICAPSGRYLCNLVHLGKGALVLDTTSLREVGRIPSTKNQSVIKALSFEAHTSQLVYARDRVLWRSNQDNSPPIELYRSNQHIQSIWPLVDGRHIACTVSEALMIDGNEVRPLIRFPESILKSSILEDGLLMTVSQNGTFTGHSLETTLLPKAELTANPGSTGRQVEINNVNQTLLYRDWTQDSVFLSPIEFGRKMSFKKLSSDRLIHQRLLRSPLHLLPRIRPKTGEIVTRIEEGLRFHTVINNKVESTWTYPLPSTPRALAFDHSGNQALIESKGALYVANLPRGEPEILWTYPSNPRRYADRTTHIVSMELRGDGAYAATIINGLLSVVRIADKTVVFQSARPGTVRQFCLHPLKPIIVYEIEESLYFHNFEEDRLLDVWDFKETMRWGSFSPDGTRLFTLNGYFRTAQVWDWEHHLELLTLEHASRVNAADISADGLIFVSTDHDPNVRLRIALPWWLDRDDPEFQRAADALMDQRELAT